jgi:hypothetical protein
MIQSTVKASFTVTMTFGLMPPAQYQLQRDQVRP